jgi:hypothetical protein
MAAQLGWLELTATASGLQAKGTSTASPTVVFSRELQVAGQPYELQVKAQHPDGVWRFQLQSTLFGGQIPRGFKLRLLTENREPFENNEIIATEAIPLLYRDVEIDPGEGLVWEVAPTPEGYDQEILFLG